MKLKDKIDKRYWQWLILLAIAVIIIEVVGQLADHASDIFSAVMTGLGWLLKVIKPIIIGFVIAYIFKPVNDFFTKQYSKIKFLKKSSRILGVLTVLVLLVLTLVVLLSVIVFSVTDKLKVARFDDLFDVASSLAKNVTDFYDELMAKLDALDIQSTQIEEYVDGLTTQVMTFLQDAANGVVGSLSNLSGYLTTIMFGLIIGIYFMIDGESMVNYFSEASKALLSEKRDSKIRTFLNDLHEIFSGYIHGQLLDILFMIVATSIGMVLAGVSMAPIIGILTGIANLIPYLGPIVGYVSIVLISIVDGNYTAMIVGLIVMLVIQVLDGNIIEAKLLGKSIEIHPLLVVIFLIFGNAIGGLTGMILAVPVGAYIQKKFTGYVENKRAANNLEHVQTAGNMEQADDGTEFVDIEYVEKKETSERKSKKKK